MRDVLEQDVGHFRGFSDKAEGGGLHSFQLYRCMFKVFELAYPLVDYCYNVTGEPMRIRFRTGEAPDDLIRTSLGDDESFLRICKQSFANALSFEMLEEASRLVLAALEDLEMANSDIAGLKESAAERYRQLELFEL